MTKQQLNNMARNILEKFDYDFQQTLVAMVDEAKQDQDTVDYFVREGLKKVISDILMALRYSRKSRQYQKAVDRVIETIGALKAWRLETGLSLGESTRGQLIQAAEHLERTCRGVMSRSIMYRRLAALLPDDESTLSSVITDADVKKELEIAEQIAAEEMRKINASI